MTQLSREVLPFVSRELWLEKRLNDVTSTDAAALCSASSRKSRYQLWNEKIRGLRVPVEENEAMRLGKCLEGPIAEHLAREHGFEVEHMPEYRRIPEVRLGSSFDYVLRDRSALLEIKLVGPQSFRTGWIETDFGLEAPIEIEAQVQTEMLCAEIPVCFIGVLCGTQTYLLRREFDQAVADRLVREAGAFWESPEPEPGFPMDSEFITRLYAQATPGKVLDADAEITQLLAEYDEAGKAKREADRLQEAAKARLLLRIGDAEKVASEIGSLSCGMVKEADISYHREAYRRFSFYARKNK